MRISVFGLGFIGTVSGTCISDCGHEVIAVDTDLLKVKCIQEGRAPIIEPGLNRLIADRVADGSLRATMSCEEAIMNSDMSLICVDTPSQEDGSLALDYIRSVCSQIGVALKRKESFHSVVLRSPVVPGTARSVAIPILEDCSGKTAGVDFGFGNNPEFLREGTAIFDYFNPPKVVMGTLDDKTSQALSHLYKGIKAPKVITEIEVAEGVKYADNAWYALKIGFTNEVGNIMKAHGVDSHKVMDIFCLDTKSSISKSYLKPGFAFGGSCLPKDIRAIGISAKQKGIKTPIFDSLLEANDEQVRRAHQMVISSGKRKIAMLGLSSKAGTDDLRESPLVTLADLLIANGFDLSIYDPSVTAAANMDGANRKYIREDIPHISRCLVSTSEEAMNNTELCIIGNHGEDFGHIIRQANDNVVVIDLVRLKNAAGEGRKSYRGICW